jgi:hypothetical protein
MRTAVLCWRLQSVWARQGEQHETRHIIINRSLHSLLWDREASQ